MTCFFFLSDYGGNMILEMMQRMSNTFGGLLVHKIHVQCSKIS